MLKMIALKKPIAMALAVIALATLSAGCGAKALSGKISVAGSTALGPMLKQAKADFETKNPKVTVDISGGGSFVGLSQVASGAINIGASDVAATAEYKDKNLVDHVVAIAPFAIIVNPGVTVDGLTTDQFVGIFTGTVKNWKEVGGPDQAIAIIGRAASSGSRATIKATILGDKDFDPKAVVMNSSGDVRKGVGTTPGAIGYVDLAFVDTSVKALKVNGVACTTDTVVNGQYKIYANEHLYTVGEAKDASKAFIDFTQSQDFQDKYVGQLGFVPASKMPK
ncbi:MAG TPA: phosphate ABC transporter substrate-binding protein [Bacillota bacterium]|jgi:phosphate transport system substrate-binding protein